MKITELVTKAHANAVNKGFWDHPREVGTMIALVHSELSEALEADRHNDADNFAEELADVVIRIADMAGGMGINLEQAIVDKMEINAGRAQLHGKAY